MSTAIASSIPPSTDSLRWNDLHHHARVVVVGLEQRLRVVEVGVGVVAVADLLDRQAEHAGRQPLPLGQGHGAGSIAALASSRAVNLLQAIVLGIVQGLTEFLPISSSAHQRIVPALLGWEDPGAAFTAVTQLGTEAAVLIFFRHELWAIATKWLRALARPGAALASGRAARLVPDRGHDPDRHPRLRLRGRRSRTARATCG